MKIVILSGAGISAESGVPTFRDADGLWHKHRIEDVADFNTWETNFDLVHQFYSQRRIDLGTVQPHTGHYWFADLARRYEVNHLAQNIDDLLERAGHPPDRLFHLHGFLTNIRCITCGHSWDIGYTAWDPSVNGCPQCDGKRSAKPGVVFFNEQAPMYTQLYQAFRDLTADDVVIIAGTMGNVVPVDAFVMDSPAVKILNNLERNSSIDDTMFDHVYYEPLSSAVDKMDLVIRRHFGEESSC